MAHEALLLLVPGRKGALGPGERSPLRASTHPRGPGLAMHVEQQVEGQLRAREHRGALGGRSLLLQQPLELAQGPVHVGAPVPAAAVPIARRQGGGHLARAPAGTPALHHLVSHRAQLVQRLAKVLFVPLELAGQRAGLLVIQHADAPDRSQVRPERIGIQIHVRAPGGLLHSLAIHRNPLSSGALAA